ncbi:MAG: hypothetical protein J4G09_04185 [Proteobacteria bacterium]|nr:hypothetical protein [Pseudomonadota bacterium]
MPEDPASQEPPGATWFASRGRIEFTLLSRGDRVRGRCASEPSPERALLLLAAADGCADSPLVERLQGEFSSWLCVAGLDLPLCGSRRSDKLAAEALDSGSPATARLRAELEAQVASDLSLSMASLLRCARLEPRPGAFLGVRLGPAPRAAPLGALALAAGSGTLPRSVFAGLPEGLARVFETPEEPPGRAWLDEVAAFLRARLTH